MFKSFWNGVIVTGNFLSSFLLLAIRLYWGYQFIITGFGKFMALGKVAAYFQSLGIPLPYLNVILSGSTELIGGALLLLGLFSRIAAIPLLGVLTVAYLTAGRENLMTLISKHDPAPFFADTAFLFLYAVLVVFCFGPGKISFDYWLREDHKA